MDAKHEAKKLLRYYFRLIAEGAGINWTSDNDAEIDAIVEFLLTASVVKNENWQQFRGGYK